MHPGRIVIAAIAALALGACSSSMPLQPDFEPEADLEGTTTYVWVPPPPEAPASPDPDLDEDVHCAVGAELARMGFVQGNVDADLQVRAWFVDEPAPTPDAVFVDVLSPDGEPVWRGTASLGADVGEAHAEHYAAIHRAVAEALDDFPR